MKTITCTCLQESVSIRRSSRRGRTGLHYIALILGVLLILASNSLFVLADVPLFKEAVNFAAGVGLENAAVGDFNGDGKLDLAVSNTTIQKVSILTGNGDGTFQQRVEYSVDYWPISVVTGDFNGDGKTDLAVANMSSNNVSILLGNGNGTFQGAVNYAAGERPVAAAAGDFNGDGKPDLAVANESIDAVTILLGNGDGTFQGPVSYAAGDRPYSIAVGDFNSDGKPDLAAANEFSDNVSILLGNGDGTFQGPVNYAAGDGPFGAAVGDFNGDGKLDLTVANEKSDNVSILLGNGDGTFGGPINYSVGESPASVALGDFNGDGKLDLAVTNVFSHDVSILLGNGNGTFQEAVEYSVGSMPYGVVVGDFNSDRKPDLAVVNKNSGNVSILLRTASVFTSLVIDGSIPDLIEDGSAYDLNSILLTGLDQFGQPMDISDLQVIWICSDTTGSISEGHYLIPAKTGDGGIVTPTVNGIAGNPLSFSVLPAVNNADLSALTVTPGSISGFNRDTVTYAVYGSGAPDSLTVTAAVYDPRSELTISGQPADSSVSQTVTLENGSNLIPIVVTAADGRTQKAYVISVNGTVSDAELNGLSVSMGVLGFDPYVTYYDLGTVDSSESGIDISASPHDPKALVLLNGRPVQAGVPERVELAYGTNSIEVIVVAQDATTKSYTIDVTRSQPPIVWDAGRLRASDISATGLTLTWPAASCDAGISGYNVYQEASLLSTVRESVYSCNVAGLTPDTPYDFSIKAVDTSGGLSSPLTLSVSTGSGLRIATATLPGATVNQSYSTNLEAVGGKAPYIWNAEGLPVGLVLNTDTGAITGTLTAAGTSVVNIILNDSSGLSTSKGFTIPVFYPVGTGKYTITPDNDPNYTAGITAQGIATMTANSGVNGFTYFRVNVAVVQSHSGTEAVVFKQVRNGTQLAINVTKADFDRVDGAMAAFNVNPGDVIEVYIVDDISSSAGSNPSLLQ